MNKFSRSKLPLLNNALGITPKVLFKVYYIGSYYLPVIADVIRHESFVGPQKWANIAQTRASLNSDASNADVVAKSHRHLRKLVFTTAPIFDCNLQFVDGKVDVAAPSHEESERCSWRSCCQQLGPRNRRVPLVKPPCLNDVKVLLRVMLMQQFDVARRNVNLTAQPLD